jgi:antitoxin (DNA-binding transcriptional repressor) of toxin-antitoxin stability system
MERIMSHTVKVEEFGGRLADLIASLNPGDEIMLTSEDRPVAKIVPQAAKPRRQPGACKGMLTILKEDDEHLADFKDYM